MEQDVICIDTHQTSRWLDELVSLVSHHRDKHHHGSGYCILFCEMYAGQEGLAFESSGNLLESYGRDVLQYLCWRLVFVLPGTALTDCNQPFRDWLILSSVSLPGQSFGNSLCGPERKSELGLL